MRSVSLRAFQRAATFVLAALLGFLSSSCTRVPGYYVVGNAEQRQQLRQLLSMLARDDLTGENRFIVVQQISYYLLQTEHRERQITFLISYVLDHPSDPYIAQHLLTVAEAYREAGAVPFAARYYRQILRNTPDLEVQGRSIHFHCLTKLVELSEDPEALILYHKELISRFPRLINLGETYFHLGRMYEEVGEWELAMQAYDKFIQIQDPKAEVPGFPKSRKQAQEKVAFYHSRKDWTVRDLTVLVEGIKNAIRTKDMRALLAYRAKASFFTKSWKAPDELPATASEFEITRFLGAQVTISNELDPSSTNREAYLRLYAYADFRIPVWYLYFRRVEYEPDPEINGNWEWAGIFLGERT
jgi:tetratricopeptide (TPR) repeat protein